MSAPVRFAICVEYDSRRRMHFHDDGASMFKFTAIVYDGRLNIIASDARVWFSQRDMMPVCARGLWI